MSVKSQIRDYILEFITYGEPIKDDESLVVSGMIDSTGAMELVLFVEETFDVKVPNELIGPETLDNINAIEGLVSALNGSEEAA